MYKKITIISITLLILSILIPIITEASNQGELKKLSYSNILEDKDSKDLITLEGKAVKAMLIYEDKTLFIKADDIVKALSIDGKFDSEKNIYIINGQEFTKRKLYEAKNPSTGEKLIFFPVVELLKFLKIRYTLSELGTYPTVRIQTSSFALPTPTSTPGKNTTPSSKVTGTPTPAPQVVYSTKCSKCHALSRVTEQPHGSNEWPAIVGKMSGKDPSWINGKDAEVITQYLTSGGR